MWADILLRVLKDLFLKNVLDLSKTEVNEVKAVGTEIRMNKIQNRRTDDS